MASAFISSPAEIVLIDSRTRSGTVTLPVTNSIPFRVVSFKDQYGSFSNSTLTLSTQVGESFDDGTTTKTFSNAFTSMQLYATSSKWMVLNATQTVQQTISSLIVNQLIFGTGSGWTQFGPVQASIVSSIQTNTNDAYINNLYIGNQSTINDAMFYGLFGNYNNTVLAEISTGAGQQELLVFKGSSTSDRIRFQTTGNFVIETGVSARLFNSNTTQTLPNATPAFIINTSSNVGIQTATPGATLDVAGTARAVTLSSQQLFVSSFNGDVPIVRSNVISTVTGLGSAGYLSSLNGLRISTGFITASSVNLIDPFTNAVNFLTVSSAILLLNGAGLAGTSGGGISGDQLLSTTRGLGSAGYVSTFSLMSTTAGITTAFQTSGFLSTPVLLSTLTGLGSAGFVSTLSLVSTTQGLQTFISSFIDPTELASTVLSTVVGIGIQPSLTSTVAGLGTAGYVSTLSLVSTTAGITTAFQTSGFLSTPVLLSTLTGLGSAGYVSTFSLMSTTAGITTAFQTSGFLSTPVLLSTLTGLGSAGYVSSLSLVSTTQGLQTYISTFIDPTELASTVLSTVVGIGIQPSLTSTVAGLGTAGFVSTLSLVSTTQGLQTYISSFIDPMELASSVLQFISAGFFNTQLASTATGLGTLGYISSASLTSTMISTTNAINTAISSFSTALGPTLGTIVRSTVAGLGQLYLSTPPLVLSTTAFLTSSVLASTVVTSSLLVNSITIGTGTGWVNLGPLQTVALSSIQVNANDAYLNNVYVGIQSTINDVMFYGLFGNYNNTVLAEVSTGAGTQELLVFKGSSTSDRVRVQTTGNFVVETGVSARLFNSNTTATLSNATPAFIINTSSNVGIQTATPGATLDVAGTARAVTLSSQQLFVSSFNGDVPITRTNVLSTVTGLGSANYVSSSSLASTTFALQTAGFLSSPVLVSTVAGLGSAGYISTTQLGSSLSSFSTSISTRFQTSSLVAANVSAITVSASTMIAQGQLQVTNGSVLIQNASSNQAYTLSLATTGQSIVTNYSIDAAPKWDVTVTNSTKAPMSFVYGSADTLLFLDGKGQSVAINRKVATYNLDLSGTFFGDSTITKSIGLYDVDTFGYNYLTTSSGVLLLNGAGITGGAGSGGLQPISLLSTVAGLGTAGYISSQSLASSLVSSQQAIGDLLAYYIDNLGSLGYTSTLSLNSTLQGLGSAGYVSTAGLNAALASTTTILVTATNLASTTAGVTTAYQTSGFLSTLNLTSTVTGLGTVGYISSASLASSMQSTVTELLDAIQYALENLGTNPGYVSSLSLFSTVAGLGSATYVSTATLNTALASTTVPLVTRANLVSTTAALQTGGFISSPNLFSTVAGLGTAGYISSASFESSLVSSQQAIGDLLAYYIDNLGSLGYTSTLSLNSTVQGLGSAGYVSTATLNAALASTTTTLVTATNLASTTAGVTTAFQTSGFLSTPNLTSTVAGLGTVGYISSASLASSMQSTVIELLDAIQFALENLGTNPGYVSSLSLFSTVQGLGSATYVSTATLNASLASTTATLVTVNNLVSTTAALQIAGFISSPNLFSTVAGLGTAGYISSASFESSLVSSQQAIGDLLAYYIDNLGSLGYASSLSVYSTVQGLGSAGYVSTGTLNAALASTTTTLVTATNLASTTAGVTTAFQTSGFLSTPNLTSTVTGLGTVGYISSPSLASSLQSTVTVLLDAIQYALDNLGTNPGYVSSLSLFSTVGGLGTAGYVSTTQLGSSLSSFSTAMALRFQTSSFIASSITANVITNDSSFIKSVGLLDINTSIYNYLTTSSGVLLVNGAGVTGGTGGAGLQPVSLFSTVGGLGQIYLSTIPAIVSTTALLTSSVLASTVVASSIFTSTVTGSQIQFVTLSSLAIFTSSIVAPYVFAPQFFTF